MAHETEPKEDGDVQVVGLIKRVLSQKREYKITEGKGLVREEPKIVAPRAKVQLNTQIMERRAPKEKKVRTMSDVKV